MVTTSSIKFNNIKIDIINNIVTHIKSFVTNYKLKNKNITKNVVDKFRINKKILKLAINKDPNNDSTKSDEFDNYDSDDYYDKQLEKRQNEIQELIFDELQETLHNNKTIVLKI